MEYHVNSKGPRVNISPPNIPCPILSPRQLNGRFPEQITDYIVKVLQLRNDGTGVEMALSANPGKISEPNTFLHCKHTNDNHEADIMQLELIIPSNTSDRFH